MHSTVDLQASNEDQFNRALREELENINQSLNRIKSLSQKSYSELNPGRVSTTQLKLDKDINQVICKSLNLWNNVMVDLEGTTNINIGEIQRQSEGSVYMSQSSNLNVLNSQVFSQRQSVQSSSKLIDFLTFCSFYQGRLSGLIGQVLVIVARNLAKQNATKEVIIIQRTNKLHT